jgi:hypothetical protein
MLLEGVENANDGNNGVSVQKGERKLKAATSSSPAPALLPIFYLSLAPPPSLSLSKAKNGGEDGRKAGAVCIALIRCSEHGSKLKVCFAINGSSPSIPSWNP